VSFLSKLFRDKSPQPDWVEISGKEFACEAPHGDVRVWRSLEGDAAGVYFFNLRPDLPAGEKTERSFLSAYEAQLGVPGVSLVEGQLCQLGDFRALRAIVKTPQLPSGMAYVAGYTIPFETFSYVVKVQCEEHGITGVREAALLVQKLATGKVTLDGDTTFKGDWNPDDSQYDDQFPKHSLSRARKNLERLGRSIRFAPELANFTQFELPPDRG
jgi:hypothetical protein